ncbi:C6 transcription factor [Seiridium cupressi]
MRTPSAATSQTPPSNLSHVRSTRTAMSIGGSLYVYGRDDPRPLIRGMIHKTRHFGQSHWMNVATLFKDMFMDIEPLLREPTCPVIPDLQRCKSLARTIKVRRRPTWPACMVYELPERHIADALVDGYLRTLESVHRILHVPSFRRDYEALWHPDAKPDPAFVILVKLVLAIGAAAYDDSFSLRESSIRWVYETHTWLTEPCPTKHRLDLQGLQIHLLMLSAREVIGMDGDTIYIAAGDLYRRAVTMGLHIDPTYMLRKSTMITEMRRRIWNTILEICLQSSLASGTPPCFSIQDFNTEPPRNLDDDELDDDPRMMDNLESRPANEFTQVSLSLALRRTLSTRYAIVQLLNGVHMSNSYDQTLQLDKELKAAYRIISRGFQPFKSNGDPVQFGLQMVDFLMQAYLSVLHAPFANPALNQSLFAFSRRVAVETAVKIWYILRPSAIDISSFARDGTMSSSTSSDIARLGACGSGILRVAAVQAALVVALDLKTQIQEDERLESIPIRPDLLAILRDALEWSLLRIKNGELNVKSYLMFKMIRAHIESLMQNLEKNEVVQLLVKVTTEAIQTTLPLLENMVKDCQGEDLTEPPQVSFTAPPEIGWDLMLAGSELDFTNVETMGWVFNDGGTQVSLCARQLTGQPEAYRTGYRLDCSSEEDGPYAMVCGTRGAFLTGQGLGRLTTSYWFRSLGTMASLLREEEWQQHFYTIRRLWSIDLLSLDVVMKRMEQLGFYASKPDYRAKLQAWGFKQNQPSEAWKYIEHQTKKRKRDKKESDVIISGIRQLPKKWKRETSRHFYATTELNSTGAHERHVIFVITSMLTII